MLRSVEDLGFTGQLSRSPQQRTSQIIECAPTRQMSRHIQNRMKLWKEYTIEEIIDIKTLGYFCIIFRTYLQAGPKYFGLTLTSNDIFAQELINKMQLNVLFESDVFKKELVERLNYYSNIIKIG